MLVLAAALSLGVSVASGAVPAQPGTASTGVADAKRMLEANGYSDITVIGSDDRLITASVTKDGEKSVVDVDPMTGIILPHVDLPPIPSGLAPVTGLTNPR